MDFLPGVAMIPRIPAFSLLFITLTIGACKKQVEPEPVAEPTPVPVVEEPPVVEEATPDPVLEIVENLQKSFFEVDSSVLTAEARTALDHNATVLLSHPSLNLEVQGHADERGTTDYNLALGQQRAQSVYDYLVGQGVGTSRLTLISYGEELPSELTSTEQAWSLNRRAEFRITWGGESVEGTID